jgi:hypothetical protein
MERHEHTDVVSLRADGALAVIKGSNDPRWGLRMPLQAFVEVDAGDGVLVPAVVMNASYSGAYLHTEAGLAPSARIYVRNMNAVIEAFVARIAADGLGVEWLDPDFCNICRLSATSRESLTRLLNKPETEKLKARVRNGMVALV